MDLAIISNYGLNSDGGGVKVYTQNLVKALQKRGIRLFLLIREGKPTEIEEKLPENKIFYVVRAIGQLNKLKPKFVLSQEGWFTANPKDLAEKILIAMEKEWNREKIRKYAEQFTWENIAKKTLEVYRGVLK